ncbi:MAG: phosphatase PAP2 family protein [Thiohalocapsa sp.]
MSEGLLAFLRRDLRDDLAAGAERDPARSQGGAVWLLIWALAAAATGISLYQLSGYHTGFVSLNELAALAPDRLWEWLTMLGDERVAFALTLLFARRHPRLFWTLVCAALVAAAYSRGLKPLFDALRPPAVLPSDAFNLIGPERRRESFPSGHSVTAAVFFGLLVYYARRLHWRLLFLVLGLLAGLSRVALGVHWPVDVAAGLAGGALAALVGVWLSRHSPWGIDHVILHLILVGIASIMALSLWFDDSGYVGAANLLRVLSVVCLTSAFVSYFLRPVWKASKRGAGSG